MPTYCYICHCGERFERFLPISRCREQPRCPTCDRPANRDLVAEHTGFRGGPGKWPMESSALAVHPDQVPEVMARDRRHGVPTNYNEHGEPILTSAGHRKRYAESHGYFDRNAGYGDPQRK